MAFMQLYKFFNCEKVAQFINYILYLHHIFTLKKFRYDVRLEFSVIFYHNFCKKKKS